MKNRNLIIWIIAIIISMAALLITVITKNDIYWVFLITLFFSISMLLEKIDENRNKKTKKKSRNE